MDFTKDDVALIARVRWAKRNRNRIYIFGGGWLLILLLLSLINIVVSFSGLILGMVLYGVIAGKAQKIEASALVDEWLNEQAELEALTGNCDICRPVQNLDKWDEIIGWVCGAMSTPGETVVIGKQCNLIDQRNCKKSGRYVN